MTAPKFDALTLAPGTLPPRFGAPPPYGLVDLDGSGLPGVLYADGTTVAYIAPALAAADVNAELIYQAAPVPDFPIPRVADGPAALVDLDGDGRLSLSWSSPELDGYYPPRTDGGWQPFRPFRQSLLDRASQPAEFADLPGDGRADRVRVDLDPLLYNRNLGRDGFAPSQRRARSHGLPLTAPPPPNADVRSSTCSAAAPVQPCWCAAGRCVAGPTSAMDASAIRSISPHRSGLRRSARIGCRWPISPEPAAPT